MSSYLYSNRTFLTITISLTLLLHSSLVSAHGYLNTLIIDDKSYRGPIPATNSSLGPNSPSIIRQVLDVSPVHNSSNPDLNCGLNASNTAELVADAKPGSVLQFVWHGGDDQKWPHNVGPLMTYMTSCGTLSCSKFDPVASKAEWFKIYQIGRKPDGNHNWFQEDLYMSFGAPITVQLPSDLASGNYLIRNEILALHRGSLLLGAEFYVACAQLYISGSGKGAPKDNELVTFPGAYSDIDPGILDQNAYEASEEYIYPGPPVAAFVTDGASAAGSSTVTRASGSGVVVAPTQNAQHSSSATSTFSRLGSYSCIPYGIWLLILLVYFLRL